ncbi:MAG TPA: hypothetical protein VGE36_14285 [Roseateles sp.]
MWASSEWVPEKGMWKVWMGCGINGCMFPGSGSARVSGGGGVATAEAVVDDFGNLVIVGAWR